jgi:hypothetical protein
VKFLAIYGNLLVSGKLLLIFLLGRFPARLSPFGAALSAPMRPSPATQLQPLTEQGWAHSATIANADGFIRIFPTF